MHGGVKFFTGAPAGARHYVEAGRYRADDYYLAEGAGVARRYTATAAGSVAELAPLDGDAYESWVAGIDPDTGESRGRLHSDARAVRFVEVIVNGPKSWSLAAALHPDVAAAYDAAQDRAAEQILGWLAAHGTTRVGPRGGQVLVPVEGIEAAVVRHHTSRAGDPHRHLHLQINTRVFADGRWRGLHTVGVREAIAAINGIGHAAVMCDPGFRTALASHGYRLDGTGEVRELAEYTGSFSARAAQIGRNIDRYEQQWTAANPGRTPGPRLRRVWDARAWADGRPDKVLPQPGEDLTARWVAELAGLGYVDRDRPVDLVPVPVGGLDRDAAVDSVLTRLAAGASAWNAAEIRGGVEQWIAAHGVVAEPAVRLELAEDLTARTRAASVPLLDRRGVPEDVRAWTSRPVLEVEADLVARLAARAEASPSPGPQAHGAEVTPPMPGGLDAGQIAAAAALAGHQALVVVEGAAGAGKTTLLAAARNLLEAQSRQLMVVTPTLKAATVAAAEVGARTGSAAWLAHQHGWRWDDDGTWTRLALGDGDLRTGTTYAGPQDAARLAAGDLLVVDEAGMLDQDTARALLVLADEQQLRVALVGDRRQLAAVGRGGVLDLAAGAVDPPAHLALDEVHRFTRTDPTGAVTPDEEYAALTLAMRAGDDPGAVFDALTARGQITVHPDLAALQEALVGLAATASRDRQAVAVVVDTREQAADLNAAIRDRLVADGRVDDTGAVSTRAGQRIGAGDRITTRRNDRDLGVANRDTWAVTAVDEAGWLLVTPTEDRPIGDVTPGLVIPRAVTPGGARERVLSAAYVTSHVELAYASTAHGVQGDTVLAAHMVVGEHTGAASAYVGMTRGRCANTAHLVAADPAEAREQWIAVFARDRADLGPGHAAALAAAEAARYAPARPLDDALGDLRRACTAEQRVLDQLAFWQRLQATYQRQVTTDADGAAVMSAAETVHRSAARDAADARQQVEAVGALVDATADRIHGDLLTRWDADRTGAAHAARTVADGPGRLGLRRAAVVRAAGQLNAWAGRWRPHLPDLPTDPQALAEVAGSADDRPTLEAALSAAARRAAERAHPQHAVSREAAQAAQRAADQAQHRLDDARCRHEDRLAGTAPPDKGTAERLTEAQRELADAQQRLTDARARITGLRHEPALATLPPGRLDDERAAWRADRDADTHGRAAGRWPAAAPLDERPVPLPGGRAVGHRSPGPSLGR
ncbi:MobF family relaxase [Geodermatophilus sp. FMUSA9-8]|uniref:MobF family relaxase n=1 Tax=Geodermatophilus sp. FMUSA9-8 TaxID=3120155 RepID=UPI0030096C48